MLSNSIRYATRNSYLKAKSRQEVAIDSSIISINLPKIGDGSKPCTPVVHIKIAGKWMFIPLKMVSIGIDS